MATIQGIYIALFGRPADPAGLAYWTERTNNGEDLSSLISEMATLPEATDRFDGMSNTEIVTTIYQALFNREPEEEGLQFFSEALENGNLDLSTVAINILDGAQGSDQTIVENRIAAANNFTESLDTPEEIEAYSGENAAAFGRQFIQNVTDDPETIPSEEEAQETIANDLPTFVPDEGQTPDEGQGTGGGGGGAAGDTTAPVFTSPDAITINENLTDVTSVVATDASAVSYSIVGGADQTLFSIDATTGELVFNSSADFEAPSDANTDNVYDVVVQATDTSGNSTSQNIAVSVADVNELIVDPSGGGNYTTIQAAINGASSGDLIVIKAGDYIENVTFNKSVSLVAAAGENVTIKPNSGNALTIEAGITGSIAVSGIALEGTGDASANQHGIHIGAGANLDSFTFKDGSIANFGQYGIWATDGHAEAGADATVAKLVIQDTDFTDNGLGTSNPDSQIKLFGFSGSVELTNLNIIANSSANKAIELTGGLTTNSNANTWDGSDVMPSADVSINNVIISGNYARNPISFNNYLDVENVSIEGLDLSGVSSSWSLLNFDSIGSGTIDGPSLGIVFPTSYSDEEVKVVEFQGANTGQPDGPITINSIDASSIGDKAYAFLRGGSLDDTLNGTSGSEVFMGLGGNDLINGGKGVDTAVFNGSREDFTITETSSGTYQIVDNNVGDGLDEGTDTLTGIEFLKFEGDILYELNANAPNTSGLTNRFAQGFEENADGIVTGDSDQYGTVAPLGSFANFKQTDSGPFTRFDGYRDEFSTWQSKVDIYLNTDWADGDGFSYSVAANGSDSKHQRDFIFHVSKDTSEGKLLIGASNNTNFDPRETLETENHAVIEEDGWYTFEHIFYEKSDNTLEVAMNVYDSDGDWIFTEVRNNAAEDTIDTATPTDGAVGGNRYGWFTEIDVAGGIFVDNVELYGF